MLMMLQIKNFVMPGIGQSAVTPKAVKPHLNTLKITAGLAFTGNLRRLYEIERMLWQVENKVYIHMHSYKKCRHCH